MPSVELSNKALSDVTSKIMQVMARAVRLKDGHPDHLKLAVEIGMIMVDIPLSVVSCADCKQSPSFKQYGMSVTVVPPVLLSAAMEMLEHMDPMRQHFVSAPEWEKIRVDDPRIKQHPLKDKARTIVVTMPRAAIPSDITKSTAANAGGTGNPVDAAATELLRAKPKAKPLPRKKKPEQLHLDGNGIEMVPGGEDDNVQKDADTGMGKGKGKEVAPLENVQEVDAEPGRVPAMEKRRWDSSPSQPPVPHGAQQPLLGSLALPSKISKRHNVAQLPPTPPANPLTEDINADNDGAELTLLIFHGIMDVICRQGYGSTGAILRACGQCSRQKLKCSHVKADTLPTPKGRSRCTRSTSRRHSPAEDMLVQSDTDARASPLHSVPPIATLSPEPDLPSPAKPSSSPVLDPPRQSPAPTTQESMDVSGDAIIGELHAMTLEVLNDSATLSARKSDLQKVTDGLWAEVDRLQVHHIVTQEVVMTLQQRIVTQDAELHGLQGLCTEVTTLQKDIKALQVESVTRHRDLKNAQEQLTRQERTTGVLQDTYNSLHHRVLGANQSVSPPFYNAVYLATPVSTGHLPVSAGQMQAMEGLYFNFAGQPSGGNVASGADLNAPFHHPSPGPSPGPSVCNTASSSGDAFGESASGTGPRT
ncbi:hypothetical protein F4604DRAFT_1940344 [Suillus subluteus]|nr:hypothetical protein F4604DRAFT_1940344 [Suillus subluteus]